MKIDLEHLMYWIEAIRNSKDVNRTLENFWKGQLRSKEWLIKELGNYIKEPVTIDIFGGWHGVLASLLFQTDYPIVSIRNVDIDPTCEDIAITMNRLEYDQRRFRAITGNMCNLRCDADVAINTSCEHISQDDYEMWLTCLPQNALVVLQSNNYKIEEHVRTAESIDEFIEQSNINVLFSGTLNLPMYDRYMIIGKI